MLVEEHSYIKPIDAYAAFRMSANCHLLESGGLDRYAYIAVAPYHTLIVKTHQVLLDGCPVSDNPFEILASLLARHPQEHRDDVPPFQGGALGYFGYELAHELEVLPTVTTQGNEVPRMMVGIYDLVIAFDIVERRMWLISTGHPEIDGAAGERHAVERLAQMREQLSLACPLDDMPLTPCPPNVMSWRSNFDRESYEAAVQKVINYIYAGDVFQANLSQCFSAEYALESVPDRFDLYRRLVALSPAPFGAFLNFGDVAILSNSPELFLKVKGGLVETRPIKGTRPRGQTPTEDANLAHELLSSAKDRSENVMIVDLLRNDLSRTCSPHSVQTPEICGLESYANVHHLVSTVTGTLTRGKTALDLLMACFPGGSIVGAPKIRAMEIITELERHIRGAYCGAIGYIGFDGYMETNVAIRTLSINKGRMSFNVGGGIVADSDPAAEYDETLSKAAKLFEVLGINAERVAAYVQENNAKN